MSNPFRRAEMSEAEAENEGDGSELIINSESAADRLASAPTLTRVFLTQTGPVSGRTGNFGFAHPPTPAPQPSNSASSSSSLGSSSQESLPQSSDNGAVTQHRAANTPGAIRGGRQGVARSGRRGRCLCRPCRRAKRGYDCIRNPDFPWIPCNQCLQRGFTTEQCGESTFPNGRRATFVSPNALGSIDPASINLISGPTNMVRRAASGNWQSQSTSPLQQAMFRPQVHALRQPLEYHDPLAGLYYNRDLNVMLPAHGLDLQSLESHPEVPTDSEQTPHLRRPITVSADRYISAEMFRGPAMSSNSMHSNNNTLLPTMDARSRVGRIQAFLVELNVPREIIRQIVLMLRRHNV